MLKKMRWRFIGAAMAAFFAVIFTLLCFVNLWNYYNIAGQQDDILEKLSEATQNDTIPPSDSITPPFESIDPYSPEVPYMIRFFSVLYDTEGNVVQVNQNYIASISESDAIQYADHISTLRHQHGYYNNYRYMVRQTVTGTLILFLNSERELSAVNSLFWITAAIAVFCLAVVFLLIVLFSGYAIAPYLRNLESQKQFITNASHELKTPLTSISTSADVLAIDQSDNEWVQNIQMQAGRLSRLITNLVTLSRLDEEKPFPEKTEFSLSDVLWETAEPFAALAQADGLTYSQRIADHLFMTGDRSAIQQMVSILLDNAIKYSPAGGMISLTAQYKNRHIEITVKNTCISGNSNDTSRLFERFYRADHSHSSRISGTGIGLSIAKATAEAHGGSIHAKQADNLMIFCVRL